MSRRRWPGHQIWGTSDHRSEVSFPCSSPARYVCPPNKNVHVFGAARTDGDAKMKNLLGGKGANLAEMCRLGILVPPGFTISTEVCTVYTEQGRDAVVKLIEAEVRQGGLCRAGNGQEIRRPDPIRCAVGALGSRASMPGMMDTILNLGLNDEAVAGLARKANNLNDFAWDSKPSFRPDVWRRRHGLQPVVSKQEHDPFEVVIDALKDKKGVQLDTELDTDDLGTRVAFQGADSRPCRPRFSDRSLGAVVGCDHGRLPELEQRPRQGSPRTERHSRTPGETAVNVRPWSSVTGREQRHRRRLTRRSHRRRPVHGEIPDQRRARTSPEFVRATGHARGRAAGRSWQLVDEEERRTLPVS